MPDDRIFEITSEMASSMPTPQENAIFAGQERETPDGDGGDSGNSGQSGATDRFGRTFDPAIHSVDDAGNPRFTAAGRLRVRRGAGASYVGTADAPKRAGADAMAAGQAIADAIIGSAHMLMGDEWAPKIDPASGMNERLALGMAWGRYFEARGMQDIPPGWALTIVMCSYAVPRLAQPQTQKKIGGVTTWAKEKIGGLWMRWRARRAQKIAAQ